MITGGGVLQTAVVLTLHKHVVVQYMNKLMSGSLTCKCDYCPRVCDLISSIWSAMVLTRLISAFRSILASPATESITQFVANCDTKSSDSAKRTRALRTCMMTDYWSSGLDLSLPLQLSFQLAIRGPPVMIAYQHRTFFLSMWVASVAQQTAGAKMHLLVCCTLTCCTLTCYTWHRCMQPYMPAIKAMHFGQGSMPTCHMDIIQLYQFLCGNFSYLKCGFMRDCRWLML